MAVDFSLYLITDRTCLPTGRTLIDAVAGALAGGVRAVQLREKDLSAAQLYPLACALRELTARYGARLLINDRLDLALAVQADGVHLGEHSLPPTVARKVLGPGYLIGVSTHAHHQIRSAHESGADFVTFGPVFTTPSKTRFGPPQGIKALRCACASAPLPVFGLGGIEYRNLPQVLSAGVQGVALIRAVLAASDPAMAADSLLKAINTPA
ncbi:thiamine phosphate synthase [Geoalkalibacter subterraneus]|uniref:Thiamine-phosphate synthase n=1 Tax=Geoalkalibacter subterraneus TaxID=483547 RepID=A0A0B5FG74_9BACT|nr:thiamine-phosphate synthase [Geoalkalibacter subterraneus]